MPANQMNNIREGGRDGGLYWSRYGRKQGSGSKLDEWGEAQSSGQVGSI